MESFQFLNHQEPFDFHQDFYSTMNPSASFNASSSSDKKLPILRNRVKENSRLLPQRAIDIMTDWYDRHYSNPYPTFRDCEMLANSGCITINQVKQWFVNVRRRTQNQFRRKRDNTQKRKSNDIEEESFLYRPLQENKKFKVESMYNPCNINSSSSINNTSAESIRLPHVNQSPTLPVIPKASMENISPNQPRYNQNYYNNSYLSQSSPNTSSYTYYGFQNSFTNNNLSGWSSNNYFSAPNSYTSSTPYSTKPVYTNSNQEQIFYSQNFGSPNTNSETTQSSGSPSNTDFNYDNHNSYYQPFSINTSFNC